MNDSKTVFMIIGNEPQQDKLVFDSVKVGDCTVESGPTTFSTMMEATGQIYCNSNGI